jgi:hypothetical protein
MSESIERAAFLSNDFYRGIAAGRLALKEGMFELPNRPCKPRDVPPIPKEGKTYDGMYIPFDDKKQSLAACAQVTHNKPTENFRSFLNMVGGVAKRPPQIVFYVDVKGK